MTPEDLTALQVGHPQFDPFGRVARRDMAVAREIEADIGRGVVIDAQEVDRRRDRLQVAVVDLGQKLDPSLGEAYVQLGVLYFAQNDFTEAIREFQQAIKVSPQLSEAHYRLSLAYKHTGDETKAHEEFEAYQQAERTDSAAVERQRSELKQFVIILKKQPAATPQ